MGDSSAVAAIWRSRVSAVAAIMADAYLDGHPNTPRDLGTYGIYAAMAEYGPADGWLDVDLPDLIDETPPFPPDITWATWFVDDTACLRGFGTYVSALGWTDHIRALWHSPQRVILATAAMAVLSNDPLDRIRHPRPALRFIAAACGADGRLDLADAYAALSAPVHFLPVVCASAPRGDNPK